MLPEDYAKYKELFPTWKSRWPSKSRNQELNNAISGSPEDAMRFRYEDVGESNFARASDLGELSSRIAASTICWNARM